MAMPSRSIDMSNLPPSPLPRKILIGQALNILDQMVQTYRKAGSICSLMEKAEAKLEVIKRAKM